MERTIRDLVIVGGGPGGLTAAIYAMRAALDTVLIEKGLAGGQVNNSFEVENWVGTIRISGADLALKFAEHAAFYGIRPRLAEVVNIEPGLAFHCIHLLDGTKIFCRAVILATGGAPKKLMVPGEQEFYGKGVSYCAVCDGFFYRDKTVVVVGGGDSATEESLYLAKIAKRVILVHRRESLRAGMILQKRVFAEPKIEIRWNTIMKEILADEHGVTGVRLQSVKNQKECSVATDGVFIFIGFQPNNALVPVGTRMNADGYVMTDEKCESSIKGIFAIGDVREKYARQIVTAAADGCTAALAAARYAEREKSRD